MPRSPKHCWSLLLQHKADPGGVMSYLQAALGAGIKHVAQGVEATANTYQGAFGRRGATTAGTEYTSLLDAARWLLMFLATARIQGHEAQRKGNSLCLGFSEAQEQSLLSKPQGLTKGIQHIKQNSSEGEQQKASNCSRPALGLVARAVLPPRCTWGSGGPGPTVPWASRSLGLPHSGQFNARLHGRSGTDFCKREQ